MYVYYGKANMKNVNKKDRKIQHLHSIPKTNTKRYSTHDNSIWLVNNNRYWLYHIQNSATKDNPPYESVFRMK